MLLCSSVEQQLSAQENRDGRVVELVDSLDSGSSVHCGRAGSSPASPTNLFFLNLITYGRVVELVDSLDSGSSVHCGRAGSSPASPTKIKDTHLRVFYFLYGLCSMI